MKALVVVALLLVCCSFLEANIIPLVRFNNGFYSTSMSSTIIMNGTGGNLTLDDIVANIGNFSQQSPTLARTGYAVCPANQFMQNVTSNTSGIYANCTTPAAGAEVDPLALPGVTSVNASLIASNTSIWNALGLVSINFTSFTTSNTSIWDALGLVSLNFTSFTTSNNSIWSWINNAYVNVSNLQSSNGSAYTRTDTLNTTIAYINGTLIPALYTNMTNLQSSNGSLYTRVDTLNATLVYLNGTLIPSLYTNVTNLQSSNGSIYTRVDTLNTSIQNLIASNNSAYTRTNTLNLTIAYINGTQIPALVPYTGAINNVTLGNYNMTASNYSVTGSGYISGNSTCIRVNFNSTVWFGVGSNC